jgi:hypothetical protein
MKETIDKAETLNVIRSFISSLRPEATGLITDIYDAVNHLPSAQPELIEKAAYIRGFEQGRTQGMIDREGNTASFQDEECHMVATGIANFCPNCGARMVKSND